MESVLSPREIQTRIRSGESVADLARVAGMDLDRVERFAAPVIAEREHVAGLAMTSSARRRGETSSHRTLRGALSERLLARGIDADTVRWDSFRLEDGRWAVTADYDADGTQHQALFYFDLPGRYSVAGNDEGRWVLGDTTEQYDEGAEPTIDLSDELALVRVVQDIPVAPHNEPEPAAAEATVTRIEITEVEVTQVALEIPDDDGGDAEDDRGSELAEAETTPDQLEAKESEPVEESGLDTLYQMFDDQDLVTSEASLEDSGPSDAAAVPEVGPSLQAAAWEPAIVVDYPVEPSEDVEVAEGSDDPGRPEHPVAGEDRQDEAEALEETAVSEEAGAPEETAKLTEPVDQPLPLDIPEPAKPAPAKPARRKRASVPSWDEIVFGSPKDNK